MVRRVLAALVVVFVLAACDPMDRPGTRVTGPISAQPPTDPNPWDDPTAAAAAARTGREPACPRALTFSVPARWKLTGDFSAVGGLTVGGLTLVCELDGKPAGVLGIMRVFTGPAGDIQTIASGFIYNWAPDATGVQSQDVKVGTADGLDVRFVSNGHTTRDFLVMSGGSVYLVDWGGVDDDAHAAGMPAYVLARTSAGTS